MTKQSHLSWESELAGQLDGRKLTKDIDYNHREGIYFMLEQLPYKMQDLILMYHQKGMTFAYIAAETHQSVPEVKRLYNTAIHLLRHPFLYAYRQYGYTYTGKPSEQLAKILEDDMLNLDIPAALLVKLAYAGHHSVDMLLYTTDEQLLACKGIGKKGVATIREALKKYQSVA